MIEIELDVVENAMNLDKWYSTIVSEDGNWDQDCILNKKEKWKPTLKLSLSNIYQIHQVHQMLSRIEEDYLKYDYSNKDEGLDNQDIKHRLVILEFLTIMINGEVGMDEFLDISNTINRKKMKKYIIPSYKVYTEK